MWFSRGAPLHSLAAVELLPVPAARARQLADLAARLAGGLRVIIAVLPTEGVQRFSAHRPVMGKLEELQYQVESYGLRLHPAECGVRPGRRDSLQEMNGYPVRFRM